MKYKILFCFSSKYIMWRLSNFTRNPGWHFIWAPWMQVYVINPLSANLFYCNFYPLEVVVVLPRSTNSTGQMLLMFVKSEAY